MFRTIFVAVSLGLALIVSLVLFIPYGIFILFGMSKARISLLNTVIRSWGEFILWLAGTKLEVTGRDKIPLQGNLVFIGNHEGMLDIPALVAGVGRSVGFIAKKQLIWVPIISFWMMAMRCIFLDRTNVHDAVKVIAKGAESVKKGYPMAIFPEGTRSKGRGLGTFKKGSLKLALLSSAVIVPFTIQGTYEIYEKEHRIIPGKVSLQFHDPIDTTPLSEQERKELMNVIREKIEEGIKN
ncbi:MAG TPA: lysophospholipid acyltransferase family protein [Candidatus Cloacimonadota bacterium]|nr:lysophospholipid acyltransferase family protein [Candidatus Cloacimonadota bacterium]HPT71732.1 lysophospholipid acyltransferase family protein [Candidatus Cloacimonadota bacterium]